MYLAVRGWRRLPATQLDQRNLLQANQFSCVFFFMVSGRVAVAWGSIRRKRCNCDEHIPGAVEEKKFLDPFGLQQSVFAKDSILLFIYFIYFASFCILKFGSLESAAAG